VRRRLIVARPAGVGDHYGDVAEVRPVPDRRLDPDFGGDAADRSVALRSGLLANLRTSPRYLLTDCRRCYTEGKYGVSFRSTPTTSTERAPLARLAELTDELPMNPF
jgi:hypothetical protein